MGRDLVDRYVTWKSWLPTLLTNQLFGSFTNIDYWDALSHKMSHFDTHFFSYLSSLLVSLEDIM